MAITLSMLTDLQNSFTGRFSIVNLQQSCYYGSHNTLYIRFENALFTKYTMYKVCSNEYDTNTNDLYTDIHCVLKIHPLLVFIITCLILNHF